MEQGRWGVQLRSADAAGDPSCQAGAPRARCGAGAHVGRRMQLPTASIVSRLPQRWKNTLGICRMRDRARGWQGDKGGGREGGAGRDCRGRASEARVRARAARQRPAQQRLSCSQRGGHPAHPGHRVLVVDHRPAAARCGGRAKGRQQRSGGRAEGLQDAEGPPAAAPSRLATWASAACPAHPSHQPLRAHQSGTASLKAWQ